MEGDKDDYGNNPNKTTITRLKSDVQEDPDLEQDMKFTLKEYWYKKRVKRYFVIDLKVVSPVSLRQLRKLRVSCLSRATLLWS